jgi:4a-hydroxytetrahydrobiopterin dehydratase
MNDLLNKKCVPCEGGVLPFDISEIHKYQKKVDGWDIIKNEKKIFYLYKKYEFKNFLESQIFINKIGEISENEGTSPRHIIWLGLCRNKDYNSCYRGVIRK